MYFQNFENVLYPFSINHKSEIKVMTDITRNVRVRKEVLSSITLFDSYVMVDGETPESVAEKIYGKAEYHWAIMLANDRYDYITDFPILEVSMEKVIIDKYGLDHVNDVHHHEAIIDGKTFVVDADTLGSSPITNSDHERAINEGKRLIKIISPSLINQVAKEMSTL
jgi:hypothetical protein